MLDQSGASASANDEEACPLSSTRSIPMVEATLLDDHVGVASSQSRFQIRREQAQQSHYESIVGEGLGDTTIGEEHEDPLSWYHAAVEVASTETI